MGPPPTRLTWEFTTDPAGFLTAAGDFLAADPVVGTIPASIAWRYHDNPDSQGPHDWWAVVRDGCAVVGVAMRTAPFHPRPIYLLPMPGSAATLLARMLHERGESAEGVNGALPAARICAEETARLTSGSVSVAQHTRLFEVRTLVPPPPVPGRLRTATEADIDVATAWYSAFMVDADAQAGRLPGSSPHAPPSEQEMLRRLRSRIVHLWQDETGAPVHLTGVSPPSFGVARIAPVFTPPEQRSRGYAGAAVAAISARFLSAGERVCLFTDQANPTSNALYQRLGFVPVVDMVNLLVRAGC